MTTSKPAQEKKKNHFWPNLVCFANNPCDIYVVTINKMLSKSVCPSKCWQLPTASVFIPGLLTSFLTFSEQKTQSAHFFSNWLL